MFIKKDNKAETTNKTEEECVDEILNVYRQMATVA